MKKIIALLIIATMILGLSACDAGNVADGQQESKPVETTMPTTQTEGSTESPDVGQENTTIRVPGEQIYFLAPSGWEVEKENLSTVIKQNKDCLVSICYNWPMSGESDLNAMITDLGYFFTSDASSESHGFILNSTIEVTSSENGAIAGYDCVVFTGIVNNDNKWDCHVYGYTFVVNNVELMVVGLVSTQEQDTQMIAEINSLTDQIASSVRTENN